MEGYSSGGGGGGKRWWWRQPVVEEAVGDGGGSREIFSSCGASDNRAPVKFGKWLIKY